MLPWNFSLSINSEIVKCENVSLYFFERHWLFYPQKQMLVHMYWNTFGNRYLYYLCTFAILNKEDIYFALLHKKKFMDINAARKLFFAKWNSIHELAFACIYFCCSLFFKRKYIPVEMFSLFVSKSKTTINIWRG